jgi:hypothetical protein
MADVNGALKDLVSGLVGNIPEIGWLASSILSIFWPDKQEDYFQLVKDQVAAMIKKAMDEAKVKYLRNLLEGTKDNCEEYVATTNLDEKKIRCVSLDAILTQDKYEFMDDSFESVMYFLQYAVYHLTFNVDILLFYDDDKNRKDLSDLIDEYSTYAHKMEPELTKSRMGQIDTQCIFDIYHPLVVKHNRRVTHGSGFGTSVTVTSYGVAQDHNTGKDLVFDAIYTSEVRPGGAPNTKEIPGGKNKCKQALKNYRAKIKGETKSYWQTNLTDPIDEFKNAKVLEPTAIPSSL